MSTKTRDLEVFLIESLADLAKAYLDNLRELALEGGPTGMEVETIKRLVEEIQDAKERREGMV